MMVQLGEGDGRSGSGMSFIDRTGGGIICDEDCVVSRQTTVHIYIYIYRKTERDTRSLRVDHQHEALFGSRQLRDVVRRMGATDMLLHGAKAFFLEQSDLYTKL